MSEGRYYGRCGAETSSGSKCWRSGSSRYNGLCVQHGRTHGLEPQAAVCNPRHAKHLRCGSVDTVTRHACNQLVGRAGARCGLHSEQALAEAAERRRGDLADKLDQLVQRKHRVESQIASLRSELDMLTPKTSKRGDACEDTGGREPEVRA